MRRFILLAIASASVLSVVALAQINTPGQNETNSPVVYPSTGQPIPLGGTNENSRSGSSTNLPSAYQGGISNLHDVVGTNVPNHGYANPTLTNHPNPNLQMP